MTQEKRALEDIALKYTQLGSPFERHVRQACVSTMMQFVPARPSVLELGCADGYMTALLSEVAARHVVVDASPEFLESARKGARPHAEFHESLFETFEPCEKFDVVVMCYILEHIIAPGELVARARTWLKPDTGCMFIAVPNIRALSRQLGRAIGVVTDLYEITPAEREHGHRRSYDRVMLDRDIESGGAKIVHRGGLVLKPFSTGQLDAMLAHKIIGPEHLAAFEALGTEYGDLCHTIYAVAR